MKRVHSAKKKENNIITHITLGIILSLLSTFILSILITTLLDKEILELKAIPIITNISHALSVFIGTIVAITLHKEKLAIVAGTIAGTYLVIALCANMLLFSNGFEGIGAGIISIFIGGLIPILLKTMVFGKKRNTVKIRSRYFTQNHTRGK